MWSVLIGLWKNIPFDLMYLKKCIAMIISGCIRMFPLHLSYFKSICFINRNLKDLLPENVKIRQTYHCTQWFFYLGLRLIKIFFKTPKHLFPFSPKNCIIYFIWLIPVMSLNVSIEKRLYQTDIIQYILTLPLKNKQPKKATQNWTNERM